MGILAKTLTVNGGGNIALIVGSDQDNVIQLVQGLQLVNTQNLSILPLTKHAFHSPTRLTTMLCYTATSTSLRGSFPYACLTLHFPFWQVGQDLQKVAILWHILDQLKNGVMSNTNKFPQNARGSCDISLQIFPPELWVWMLSGNHKYWLERQLCTWISPSECSSWADRVAAGRA